MIRLPSWRRHHEPDALDPELLSVFAERGHPPVLDAARLARGRMRVAGALRPETPTGGWFGQRLAYALAGGGGIWGAVLGTAAAHKAAATAIGLGVLLAGGATAEVTGIGPAVREAVSPSYSSSEPEIEPVTTVEALATSEAALDDDQPDDAGNNGNGATVTDAPDDLPGNLRAQLRADGGFTLRGVLISATGDVVEVQTSVDDVPIAFDLGDATIRVPGANPQGGPQAVAAATLKDFEGYLVTLTGRCETTDGLLTEDCDLATLTVLGNAGQGGQPDDVGKPEKPGNSASANSQGAADGTRAAPQGQAQSAPDDSGALEANSEDDDTGPPEGAGRPENPGKPDGTPGND